jgi:PAS domain S-box-containing protein
MRASRGPGRSRVLSSGQAKGEILHVQRVDAPLASPLPLDLFDDLSAGVFVIDALGDVLEVNRAAADMLGYAQGELVGKNIASLTHPEDFVDCASPDGLTPGRPVASRRRFRRKDGEYRLTDGRARRLDDGRIVSVVRAMTALETARPDPDEDTEQLRFAANAVPALIAYLDSDARYVWANEAYRRWLGQSPEEVRGRHVTEVLGPVGWASVRPYVERALAGEEVTFDYRLIHESEEPRDRRVTYVPRREADGRVRGFVVLSNDITEIRTAERALRRSEHMLEQSQSTAHVGSWDATFPEGGGPPGPGSLRWSNEAYRIFGYEPGTVETTLSFFFAAVHPDDREALRAVAKEGAERGEPFEKEYRIVRPDGTVRVIHAWCRFEREIGANAMRMLGTCQDITERKRVEQEVLRAQGALRRSEERYRCLVGAITSVVWTADPGGRFVEPQPAWEAYTGQRWEDHRGWGCIAAVHPDDRGRIEAVWRRAARTGALYRCACRVWHAPSAGYRHCETGGVAIRNPDGSIREWIGTLVDVHERESAQQDLREADRRKDEFLAMLSHELRNPLAPILSAVEILDRTGPDEEQASKYRAVIARQVQHMKRLLDDLLDVSRVSQGKIELRKESLELGALLLQAVEVSRPMIVEKRHELSVKLAPGPLTLDADPTRLVQVFANLLNNAAKYTDEGGHIALEVTTEGGEAVVSVRDDGVGMRPELVAQAFDLFVQETRSLDRAQGGLGIGLTMVQILVKMHGGTVRAVSDGPGRGSVFVVRLPLGPGAPAPVARDAPSATPAPDRPLRVLVVDDNVDGAKAMGDLLEMLGHQVTIAFDGPGALAAATARPPELVLLDIGLPGMDGYAVATRLRAAGHDRAALIAITGYGQSEHVGRSTEAGFDRHLVKPVDFAVIAEICAQLRGAAGGKKRGKA